ncbi:hypothetical protein DFA_11528 [Cavenderia fasciculata]|uniref:Uncharacterized protein n=1 Tax=Cavenderia fasciculata TaxID=261658 RepID=F4QDD9_CACFS|nr:uncharacterized protein DFA_11528 [Cavenderia fasciculata]EGG13767.1 hypothetical protein DFA_11528 [Cavenderia fasciculata]|eukprot:XP_004350475.1 hypothetical protein DFA_11528 [Cavenderia fasciculata]
MIRQKNFMDVALYEMALKIFEQELELVGRELVDRGVALYRDPLNAMVLGNE